MVYHARRDGIVVLSSGKCTKGGVMSMGYYTVRLNYKAFLVHRLVAAAFLDKLVVNHIDGDRLNNRVENLECVTHAENTRHAWDTGLVKKRLCVAAYKNGVLQKEFKRLADAARWTGRAKNAANIMNSMKKGNTAYGYRWKTIKGDIPSDGSGL